MKKLVIFDLDGTLLDTIADLAAATNHALRYYGYPTHEVDAYRYFVGNGINKLFERALPAEARCEENILKIRSQFIPYYNEHNADLSRPYPGIEPMLQTLQKNGITLAVASNKYQEATTQLIRRFFPDIRFAEVFGQRPDVPAKPAPDVIFEILRNTQFTQDETIYVGDSCVDMQTGIHAGVDTVGVSWGFRPRTELEAYHPALIADCCEEVLSFIAQKNY